MPDRFWDDPTIPPPGRRTGMGSSSILPFLAKSLASKPKENPPARGGQRGRKKKSEPEPRF